MTGISSLLTRENVMPRPIAIYIGLISVHFIFMFYCHLKNVTCKHFYQRIVSGNVQCRHGLHDRCDLMTSISFDFVLCCDKELCFVFAVCST